MRQLYIIIDLNSYQILIMHIFITIQNIIHCLYIISLKKDKINHANEELLLSLLFFNSSLNKIILGSYLI
jgi:hypothetical protein